MDLKTDPKAVADRIVDQPIVETEPNSSSIREWLWVIPAILILSIVLYVGLGVIRNTTHAATAPPIAVTASAAVVAAPARAVSTATTPARPATTPVPTTASAAGTGGNNGGNAQPTPTDEQRAAAYLNQLSTEQDYCFCNRTSSSVLLLTPEAAP